MRILTLPLSLLLPLLLAALLAACGNPRSDGLSLGEERSTSDEAKITDQMISAIKEVSLARHSSGKIKRFNQSKSLGCFNATLTVKDDLSDELRQGVFAQNTTYPAKVRFANATKFDDREKDFRGMSISLFNVQGETLWGEPGQQDFLLNSHPVLFARDGSDFLEFIEAGRDDKVWQYFIRPSHFYSLKTALRGREKISNPFSIRYWSTTPFRHGPDQSTAVKYSVKPCSSPVVKKHQSDSDNFLTDAMAAQLEESSACFDFMVQFQTDAQDMPIEDASVRWDEQQSPFQTVATLSIDNQEFNTPDNQLACEQMTFNPWQSLAAHRPLGELNRLRKAIYSEIGTFRNTTNKQRQ
ncbi:MAG: catalase family protein [Desulfuromusa sp.]|nr:catalase family protein [Desulfuromusa sp.]